jgi:hypothetical protein
MRYHVLLLDPDRPHPRHFAWLDADDDKEARRLVAEKWAGERLRIVRQYPRQDSNSRKNPEKSADFCGATPEVTPSAADPRLAAVVAAWTALPESVRARIYSMLSDAGQEAEKGSS